MCLQTARELDPKINDPVLEGNRVISEGLDKALLGGIEQQLAGGMLDPIVAAKIKIALRQDPTDDFADIYVKVHEQMQKEQAAQAQRRTPGCRLAWPVARRSPPPSAMPGAAVPPGGASPSRSTLRRARASRTSLSWSRASASPLSRWRADGPRARARSRTGPTSTSLTSRLRPSSTASVSRSRRLNEPFP